MPARVSWSTDWNGLDVVEDKKPPRQSSTDSLDAFVPRIVRLLRVMISLSSLLFIGIAVAKLAGIS